MQIIILGIITKNRSWYMRINLLVGHGRIPKNIMNEEENI
jgi:hypothetical protein